MDKNKILKATIGQYKIATAFEELREPDCQKVTEIDIDTVCFCRGEKTVTKHSIYCSECGFGTYTNENLIKGTITSESKNVSGDVEVITSEVFPQPKISKNAIVISVENNTVIIKKVEITVENSATNAIQESIVVKNRLTITPGKKAKAYANIKGKEKEVDIKNTFEWLKINSYTIYGKAKPYLFFEDANNLLDFLQKNQIIEEKTGFWELFSNLNRAIDKDTFFLLYMYLYSLCPEIQFIVKNKFYNLMSSLVSELQFTNDKNNMKEIIFNMKSLFNDTVSSSYPLRIPSYVSEYLNNFNFGIRTYNFFTDLYELEPFSEETFKYMIKYNFFSNLELFAGGNSLFLEILKYDGITIKEIISHYYKTDMYDKRKKGFVNNDPLKFRTYLFCLLDFLETSKLLNKKYLPLPQDIKKTCFSLKKEFHKMNSRNVTETYKDVLEFAKNC